MELSMIDEFALMTSEQRRLTLDLLEHDYQEHMDNFISDSELPDDIKDFAVLVSGIMAMQKVEIAALHTEINYRDDQILKLRRTY